MTETTTVSANAPNENFFKRLEEDAIAHAREAYDWSSDEIKDFIEWLSVKHTSTIPAAPVTMPEDSEIDSTGQSIAGDTVNTGSAISASTNS